MAELTIKNKMGDNFLWCADIQKDIRGPLYVDIGHYSAKMSKMLAETVTEMLIEKNILKPVQSKKPESRIEFGIVSLWDP